MPNLKHKNIDIFIILISMLIISGSIYAKPKSTEPAVDDIDKESDINPSSSSAAAPVSIGVVLDSNDASVEKSAKKLVSDLKDMVKDSVAVTMDDSKILKGDGTLESAKKNLETLLNDSSVNMVIAFGLLASAEAVHMHPEEGKSLFAPFILDPSIQGAPFTSKGTSGVSGLNYLIHAPSFKSSVSEFKKAVKLNQMTVITGEIIGSKSLAGQAELLNSQLKGMNITLKVLSYKDGISAQDIPENTDGIFVFPLLNIDSSKKALLFKTLADSKYKVFAWGGEKDVDNGALLSFTDRVDFQRLNRRMSINVAKYLEDKVPLKDMKVGFVENGSLHINLDVARNIGFEPTRSMLIDAHIKQDKSKQPTNELTLKQVVTDAVKSNLTYLSTIAEVEAGKRDYWSAWTDYFPHLFAAAGYSAIDSKTADAMSGMLPKQAVTGTLGFVQNILDYRAIANISIQSALNDGRDATLKQALLDIVQTSASAFYNVQIAQANVDIYVANLEVTRYNLGMARRKNSVGLAGPAEVYRWESAEATDLQNVIVVKNQLESAFFTLNRVLHKPLANVYKIEDGHFFKQQENQKRSTPWKDILEHPSVYAQFKEFMVKTGLESAPELKSIDSKVRAKNKERRKNIAGFLVPSIKAQGTLNRRFWMDKNEGSNTQFEIPKNYAKIGVNLNWDIFEGGSKIAGHKKARLEKRRLELDKQDTRQVLKETIYRSISNLVAASESVKLTNVASKSAHRNLDIAKEAYGLGTLTLEALVDAQRQAFNADQSLASSRFRMKLDALALMRAINKIDKYLLAGDRELDLIKEFKNYLNSKKQ